MESNKYYTPEIEEFHIGFEYELFETLRNEEVPNLELYSKEWFNEIHSNDKYWKHRKFIKHICNKNTVWELQDVIFKQKYTPLNIENIIRVKYLDQEDIESLGFVFFEQINLRGIRLCFNNSKYRLDYLPENNCLIIQTNDYLFCKYSGYIKNKSELKKLLKQLKIDDTQ